MNRNTTTSTRITWILLLATLATLWLWSPLALPPIYADGPSFDEPRPFGPASDSTLSVAVGDVNGDGALDIVVGNALHQNAVYLNDGAGGFFLGTARPFGTGSDETQSVMTGDVNGDGTLDGGAPWPTTRPHPTPCQARQRIASPKATNRWPSGRPFVPF